MSEPKSEIIKKGLLGLALIVIILPFFQKITDVFEESVLKGAYTEAVKPEKISYERWFSGTYQKESAVYAKETVGFKSLLVKLNNQIDFSFFNKVNANEVILGKENFLYEINYIKTYLGTDFVGDSTIEKKVDKLKMLQDTLKKKGIDLVTVFAPGKAAFYPEYIPDDFLKTPKTKTNYDAYVNHYINKNINHIDFKKWFFELKDEVEYPLFPKGGIHWSKYGEYRVCDSLISYIEGMRNIDLPDLVVDRMEESTVAREGDDDIEGPLNLLFKIDDLKMGYPIYHVNQEGDFTKPKVLTVSDSFYWGMFNLGISNQVFNDSEFWFYNYDIYPDSYQNVTRVADINLKNKIEENDVILLIATDANLYKFAYGFIETAWGVYFEDYFLRVKNMEINIRNDAKWFQHIKEKALKKGISVNEMLNLDAKYMVELADKENK